MNLVDTHRHSNNPFFSETAPQVIEHAKTESLERCGAIYAAGRLPPILPVIYSTEPPVAAAEGDPAWNLKESTGPYIRGRKRRAMPSISTIPEIIGLAAANFVIFEILKDAQQKN